MSEESCRVLREDEVLHARHSEWPLFAVTIHGSAVERAKLAKRLACAIKHLPLRLKIAYEKDPRRSMERGVGADPTLEWEGQLLAEGLVSAERLSEIFEALLAQGARTG